MKITIKIFFLTLFLVINVAYAMIKEESKSSDKQSFFKLGFEFQESSNLCPWAKGNYNIQKKPFFSCLDKTGKKLWSVVIDGTDIEFVTEPFSNNQRDDLIKTIQDIVIASSFITKPIKRDIIDLQKALNSEKIISLMGKGNFEQKLGATLRQSELFQENQKEVFELWKKWLKEKKPEKYEGTHDEEFIKMWGSKEIIGIDIVFKLGEISEKDISIERWFKKISDTLLSSDYKYAYDVNLFDFIKDKKIELRTKLNFEPQVTIQYPVEYSIPLWFGLFGFKEADPVFSKFKNIIATFQKEDIFDKNSGLIFLHALTLYNMAPSNLIDANLLYETLDRIEHGQADVKGLLYLMSRRPFSNMWKDINIKNSQSLNYTVLFNEKMDNNKFFAKIKETFNQTNYAEEYLDKNNYIKTGLIEIISPLLDKMFYKNNSVIIDKLLSQGLLSTTMIRNFDKEIFPLNKTIFDNYYMNSIQSVQTPSSFVHYRFDIKESKIIPEKTDYDTLSPPYFLDKEDSMGYYKDDSKIDKRFGEAIIEARQIKKAGMYFLEKVNLQVRKEFFLTEPEPRKVFLNEVISLFDFINQIFDKNESVLKLELIPAIIKLQF